jgi:hypothetical protein
MSDVPPALKWLGAFAVMALVVVLTIPMALDAITQSLQIEDRQATSPLDEDDDPLIDPAEEAVLGELEDGEAIALADISGRNNAVRQATEEFVAIGGASGDAVYFAFPLIEGDPACLAEVRLELTLRQGTAARLVVYPADVPDILELEDGDPLSDEPFLTDHPRAIVETDGTPMVLFWDVTGVYEEWAGGGLTEATEPFVLAVRPEEYGDGDLRAQFSSVEAGEDEAGRLVWTADPAC